MALKSVGGRSESVLDPTPTGRQNSESQAEGVDSAGQNLETHSLAMAPSYIPPRDADFANWLLNFSTLISANPGDYGLVAGDATAIAAQNTAFAAAYTAAIDPSTRTPATVAAKDTARYNAEFVVRPYAQNIRLNAAISDALKVGLGLNLPNSTRPPIPPPTVAPALAFDAATPLQHKLRYSDPSSPVGKAKPVGSIGVEIWRSIGTVPATDPAQASYYGTFTKSPNFSTFTADQVGKVCTYFARFVTRSGAGGRTSSGPWSAPLTIAVV